MTILHFKNPEVYTDIPHDGRRRFVNTCQVALDIEGCTVRVEADGMTEDNWAYLASMATVKKVPKVGDVFRSLTVKAMCKTGDPFRCEEFAIDKAVVTVVQAETMIASDDRHFATGLIVTFAFDRSGYMAGYTTGTKTGGLGCSKSGIDDLYRLVGRWRKIAETELALRRAVWLRCAGELSDILGSLGLRAEDRP